MIPKFFVSSKMSGPSYYSSLDAVHILNWIIVQATVNIIVRYHYVGQLANIFKFESSSW